MALPSSGAISLNQMHVEAGGTTGTSCTLNDSDIRGLINAASGSEMSFDDWYGASASQSYTVGQGIYSGQFFTNYGYQLSTMGTLSPTTFTNTNTYTVKGIYRTGSSGGNFFYIVFNYSSTPPTDAFTSFSLTANGTAITGLAADASTSTASGGFDRLWMFNASNGLTSSELSDIATEFDGSGNITVTLA